MCSNNIEKYNRICHGEVDTNFFFFFKYILTNIPSGHLISVLMQSMFDQNMMKYAFPQKNPKNSDTRKIVVIILKLEQYHFTTE